MPKKSSNVDVWLKREAPRVRKALESASRYFDANDRLTVNTLEAVYGRESSFGTLMRERGSSKPAGHFHLTPETARRYGLVVSRHNVNALTSIAPRPSQRGISKISTRCLASKPHCWKRRIPSPAKAFRNGSNLFSEHTMAAKVALPALSIWLRKLATNRRCGAMSRSFLKRPVPVQRKEQRSGATLRWFPCMK